MKAHESTANTAGRRSQPPVAEEPWTLQGEFGELDLETVENPGWDLAVFWEQTDSFGEGGALR